MNLISAIIKKKKGLPVFPKCCSIFRWIISNIVMNILGDFHIVCHCSLSKHLFKTFAYRERWGLGGFWWTALILMLSFFPPQVASFCFRLYSNETHQTVFRGAQFDGQVLQ